jgi:alkylation response protein AidB-like acyl-CoA dehydrogenase
MTARTLFREEHRRFRAAVRSFIESEVLPEYGRFRQQGHVDRETWRKAGASGLLRATFPLAYAGADTLHRVVLLEEFGRADTPELLGMLLQSVRAASLIARHGSEALKRKYLPRMASGELIGALAEDELHDVLAHANQHITAVRMGERYVVNGLKRRVANGHQADLLILLAIDPSGCADSASLLVVDTAMPGFSKGPRVGDPGCGSLGLADLHFDEVPVPVENLLGEENAGRLYLDQERPGYCMDA